jgi:hypothetical protein
LFDSFSRVPVRGPFELGIVLRRVTALSVINGAFPGADGRV